jgi:hypothetical protein
MLVVGLLVLAAIGMAVTKPSEAELRAAVKAKAAEYHPEVVRPDGTRVIQANPDHEKGFWLHAHAFQYRDRFLWSDLVWVVPSGSGEMRVARGFVGRIWLTD